MRLKNVKFRYAVLFALMLFLLSCNNSGGPEKNVYHAEQIPGCNKSLLKSADGQESGFSYVFNENLNVELNLTANCCPDSDRFDYSFNISNDTIYFTVIDTAGKLCHCICNYTVKAEIEDLPRDEYTFICFYYDSVYYDEKVIRNNAK